MATSDRDGTLQPATESATLDPWTSGPWEWLEPLRDSVAAQGYVFVEEPNVKSIGAIWKTYKDGNFLSIAPRTSIRRSLHARYGSGLWKTLSDSDLVASACCSLDGEELEFRLIPTNEVLHLLEKMKNTRVSAGGKSKETFELRLDGSGLAEAYPPLNQVGVP